MEKETQMLYDALYEFLKESMPILRKNIDINSLPTMNKYRVIKDKKGRTKIQKYESPNFWQIKIGGLLLNLLSLKKALIVCNNHPQIKSLNGKWSHAFDHGISFHANYVPYHFLIELIDRENGMTFNKKTFEKIFYDLLKYISTEEKSYARIVFPLDRLNISPKTIKLEDDLRIRRLSPQELVDVLNYAPILDFFYGTGFSPWFKCILELDMPFNWFWLTQSEHKSGIIFKNIFSQSAFLKSKINQEIIIMRALINQPISSPTYVVDYRGWEYVTFSGGGIIYLPWVRSKYYFSDPLKSEIILKYKKYRLKLLNIKDDNTKQRIFVAMRKLAFSMDKPYAGDRLMDAVSGLEGLLINSKEEVTHKFAERIALLLEEDKEKRIKLQKDMKRAYKLRSQLAHGLIATDYSDTIVTKMNLGKKPKKKEIDKSHDIQRLSQWLTRFLHQTILLCIDKQTTEFNWDSSIMGTKIPPL